MRRREPPEAPAILRWIVYIAIGFMVVSAIVLGEIAKAHTYAWIVK